MSIDGIHDKVIELLVAEPEHASWSKYLDIGAGRGSLITKVKANFPVESSACDYTDALMQIPGQNVDIANLNHEPLPYPDALFDVVTATEVIEHLEDFRRVVREIYRVLKPGGVCILSTPNILNLNSRLRFLWFGFWNLFGPLPIKHRRSSPKPASIPQSAMGVRARFRDRHFTKTDRAPRTSSTRTPG